MGELPIARATFLAVLLVSISHAWAQDAEDRLMAQVRLTTEPALAAGCTRVGALSDDSLKDLRRKIVKAGGNAAVLSFGIEDMSTIYAEVYRCPANALPRIPPPPAGPPPPPPSSGQRPPPPPPGQPPPPPPPPAPSR